jgi:xanthine dehydrogenase accessory factor
MMTFQELERILRAYQALDFTQRKAALATVVGLSGSGYRRPGARMLISDDGRWTGAVSGGCLEGDVLRKARQVMEDHQPQILVYDTMDDSQDTLGLGLGCNGIIDILLEPLIPTHPSNLLERLSQMPQQEKLMLVTVIAQPENPQAYIGDRLVMSHSLDPLSTIPPSSLAIELEAKAREWLEAEKRGRLQVQGHQVFFDLIQPDIRLLVFGAGYDAVALVEQARMTGFHVTVTDDCVVHIQPKRFQQAHCLVYSPREALASHIPAGPRSAAVLISHNYQYDKAVLEYLLTTPIPYIGIMGPGKRGQKMMEELHVSPQDRKRIFSPVGLDIGAETPEEIALSVVAEIRAFFSGRNGQMLRYRQQPIHISFSSRKADQTNL